MIKFKKTLLAAAVLAAGSFALSAQAATVTANMGVKIVIQNACDVTTTAPTDLDFGTHGVLNTVFNETTAGGITVACTTGATYNIGLSAGANPSTAADINTRRMINGTSYVGYQLYTSAARTTAWGNTVGTNTVASTGTGTAQTFQVYGKVPVQTTPAAGTYTDTVLVTVTY